MNFLFKKKAPVIFSEVVEPYNNFENKLLDVLNSEKYDVLFPDAVNTFFETKQASVSMIQRKLRVDYRRGSNIMDLAELAGFVGEFDGATPRKILISESEWRLLAAKFNFPKENCINEKAIKNCPSCQKNSSEIEAVDFMDGHAFEYWCADLLKKNGFINVEVTQGSGDQGVDILAQKDGIKYAIQCKCYSSDLGNTPVQEVSAGKSIYRCHVGAVMTNRFFTSGASVAADATGTLLWDRNTLKEFIDKANKE